MIFDVIEITDEEVAKLSTIQMQLLRTAQKNKNDILYKAEQDLAMFKRIFLTDGMKNSSLLESKEEEIQADCDRKIAVIAEQLVYAMKLNEPYPDRGDVDEDTGYIVDFTLSYTDRYIVVRDYYLAIEDPATRLALYSADETAKRYLGSYYATLYNVLNTYSK